MFVRLDNETRQAHAGDTQGLQPRGVGASKTSVEERVRTYLPRLTATVNRKGVLDVDTVKGCTLGMRAYPNGGCYGQCYAAKMAKARGIDFCTSISRTECDRTGIERIVAGHSASWFRIGCMGDPCHDWKWTIEVCAWLGMIKTPVVVTKHWIRLSDEQASEICLAGAIVNTSISALDTEQEREHRLGEFHRLRAAGVKSVLRIVSCQFGLGGDWMAMRKIQNALFENRPNIDNPLRAANSASVVRSGFVVTQKFPDIGRWSSISIASHSSYIGTCAGCPDQCGVALCAG